MLEGNGVYSQEDIAKIQKANPNLRVLSEKIIYADSRNVEDGRKYSISIKCRLWMALTL